MFVSIPCAYTPGRDIGMAWGGLFIFGRAFGDASIVIISETSSHAFFISNSLTATFRGWASPTHRNTS